MASIKSPPPGMRAGGGCWGGGERGGGAWGGGAWGEGAWVGGDGEEREEEGGKEEEGEEGEGNGGEGKTHDRDNITFERPVRARGSWHRRQSLLAMTLQHLRLKPLVVKREEKRIEHRSRINKQTLRRELLP